MLIYKKLKFNQRLKAVGITKEDYGDMVFAIAHNEKGKFDLSKSEMIEIVDYVSGKTNKRPRIK